MMALLYIQELILDVTAKTLIIIVLICMGAFFSLAEISITGARKLRLQQMIEQGDLRAEKVLNFRSKPGPFFSVIQIGVNAVAILGGIVGDSAFSEIFEIIFKGFVPADYLGTASFLVSFITVTLLFVLFADLIPRRISLTHPEAVSVRVIGMTILLSKLLMPLVWFLTSSSTFILKMLGISTKKDDQLTSDDIVATVDAGAAAGLLAPSEQSAIENVMDLENRLVPSAMTPRESVVFFTLDEGQESVTKKLAETPHTSFLVCDRDVDHVVGYVDAKDFLSRVIEGKPVSLSNTELIKKVPALPDTLSLSEALEVFKTQRADFAVVVNEYALTVGIITINDIMSTVMADFVTDPEDAQIVSRDDGTWLIDGSTPVDDVEIKFGFDRFPDDESYETMAGFMMYMLRRVPKLTDRVEFGGYRFEVIDVDNHRINQILTTKLSEMD